MANFASLTPRIFVSFTFVIARLRRISDDREIVDCCWKPAVVTIVSLIRREQAIAAYLTAHAHSAQRHSGP